MKLLRSLAAAVVLVLAAACRMAPGEGDRPIYAPHEEGLTLSYENPSLDGSTRMNSRLQVRVESMHLIGPGVLAGEVRHTRLQGEDTFHFEARDGGLKVLDDQKRGTVILPDGFPDRTASWEEGGIRNRILGRAVSPAFDRLLPRGASKVGIWIESMPVKEGESSRTRTFLLPDIGSAEVMEWREGRWVTSMRLAGRSFTDAKPSPPAAPAAPAAARKK